MDERQQPTRACPGEAADASVTGALVSVTVGPDGIDGLYWVQAPDKPRAYERSARGAKGGP
ncbi:hypothetical protein [Streptomyces eurythermus]|uniref:hypothetical protein n=1 Tax=Streptomyces eurythermus TaxID=42237 RepID=UPI0033F46B72